MRGDLTQGSLWGGSKRTILRAVLRSPGWRFPPSLSASQDRPRDVFLWRALGEGWETTNQMPKMDEHMADPLLMSGRLVSVRDSVHDFETGYGSCDVLLYLHARP